MVSGLLSLVLQCTRTAYNCAPHIVGAPTDMHGAGGTDTALQVSFGVRSPGLIPLFTGKSTH